MKTGGTQKSETREKIAKTMKGKNKTTEHKEHIRDTMKGKKKTEEHKAKIGKGVQEAAKQKKPLRTQFHGKEFFMGNKQLIIEPNGVLYADD